MSNYGVFARYYDRLCKNVDYEVRSDYISGFFNAEGISGGKLLDLACGTGEFSRIFSSKGYYVTAMDLSEDMLTVAKSKAPQVNFIKGDITDFDFNNSFDACICCLDSINHLIKPEMWQSCFSSVSKSLKSGGMFVFDVNTVYKHKNILSGHSFVFDEDDFFLAWDNEGINDNLVRIFLDFFVYNGKSYDRYSECFDELALDSKEILSMLNDFEVLGIYNDLSTEPENAESERLYFICKRK